MATTYKDIIPYDSRAAIHSLIRYRRQRHYILPTWTYAIPGDNTPIF
jgi:hypothetical protein